MTVLLPDRFIALSPDGQHVEAIAELVQEVTDSRDPVRVEQLKGGITNQLLLAEQGDLRVLVRLFGKGTDTFIDREREFAVHQSLQALGLAPKLYCQFGNGLIYGFISGRTTAAEELSDQYIMTQVSHRLAQWHATLKPADVALNLKTKNLGDFWDVLHHWVQLCPDGVLPLTRAELEREFDQLKQSISKLGGVEIMGHCDLLSGNILVSNAKHGQDDSGGNSNSSSEHVSDPGSLPLAPYGTREEIVDAVASDAAFIDYEYSIPCPRAFDIANHFQEWQGYDCKKDQVPQPEESSPKLIYWCNEYLRTYELLSNNPQDISELVTELQTWWGMPGFYWGVWSAIQSKSSDIDFGYHDYASNRFQEYLDWKKRRAQD